MTEYQNICRIKKAQLLLREAELSMTDIALEAGFINLPYFERVFRKTTSLTPLQYRRQMRPYS
ncbi:MAG: helix-turn-helix domain-containing protein [Clostridium sp.]